MTHRFIIRLPDPGHARGSDPAWSFTAHGADGFAEQLQDALRSDRLFVPWRDAQDEPDDVDPALGAVDPEASVRGEQRGLQIDLFADTRLSGDVLRHRMRLLAGNAWELRDVR